jgi:hypothetical protein
LIFEVIFNRWGCSSVGIPWPRQSGCRATAFEAVGRGFDPLHPHAPSVFNTEKLGIGQSPADNPPIPWQGLVGSTPAFSAVLALSKFPVLSRATSKILNRKKGGTMKAFYVFMVIYQIGDVILVLIWI